MPFYLVIVNGMILLFILTYIYRRQALKNVTYARRFSRMTVYEGDRIEMVEEIENRKLLPVPWLRLESYMSRELKFDKQANLDINSGEMFQNHLSLFSLRPYRRIVRRHELRIAKRGLYSLNSATMTAGEPLGIVETSKQFPLTLSLLVYPLAIPLQELPLPNHSWLGNIVVRRWIVEDPFLTAGVREYAPGDSLSNINWKATARMGSLQIHRKDHTADHRLVICLNIEINPAMWRTVTEPERIERGIRYAASVAGHALKNGIETGFICNGWLHGETKAPIRVEPQGGSVQGEVILAALAKLQLETSSNMAYLLDEEAGRLSTRTDYLIITCHRDEKLVAAANRLRALGNGIEWMDIPADATGGEAHEYGA
ncbi:DUF58 domain-containing protein [Cohnella faecalis]|uniref:DUF58 domain-containing protein n=1 Tax=Cohnella faecalis TaxID=2315694 RepID=A0A398CTD6_9BACL|nr:DUF58 domain-containing protein [Cohnella faecalis]RIE04028.1 DUF58 domain-containing protein [Cohnella faecalis]